MQSRERFLTALRCEQPDRVPIWDWVNNPALYEFYLGQTPQFFDARLAVQLSRALGLDAAWIPAGGFMALMDPHWHWLDPTTYRDEWGTRYQREEGAWPTAFPAEYPVQTPHDWERLLIPNPDEDWRFAYARDAVDENKKNPDDRIAIVAGIRGPFSSASMLMGLQTMSFALADHRELLEAVFSTTMQFWTQVGLRVVEQGVDALVIHDDMGSNTGTLFSPRHLRQLVFPYLAQEIATLKHTGVPIILHSCGNINAILPDLVAMGIAGLNNLQRSAHMDLQTIKHQFGKQICLIGNVDCSNTMAFGSTEAVTRAVKECLQLGSPGGGHILATDHSFHKGVPIANAQAFIATGKKFGVYPLDLN